MSYEVVVVGGGIGGLTIAALLAARGVNVCLLERESQPGGCVAGFEKFGYLFDSSVGIYNGWKPGEIHDQVFAELPVKPPEVSPLDPVLMVRLPDQTEIPITSSTEHFEQTLLAAFPECADRAIEFYREAARLSSVLSQTINKHPDVSCQGSWKLLRSLLPDMLTAAHVFKNKNRSALDQLGATSARFKRFIDAQLQLLTQKSAAECSYLSASLALNVVRDDAFSIRGGATALGERLVSSLKTSGGRIRFDTPVLRLAYDSAGQAVGVDLLSGETIEATRAIISNLTVWDTYGKLIGLNRTPLEIRKRLTNLSSWGVYLMYLGMNETTASRLPNDRILALTGWQETDPESSLFALAAAPAEDQRAPEGQRAATIVTFSEVDQWFTYHQNEEQHEQKDQATVEAWWPRIHQAIPELGDGLELIETATPRTFYDLTRRKLGMVGALRNLSTGPDQGAFGSQTSLGNVFMVGDTTIPVSGIAGVTRSALALANHLTP